MNNTFFFIKKNSSLPLLKYPITDWLMRKHGITADMLENCAITFSLYDLDNDGYRIANKAASLVINEDRVLYPEEEKYTLVYKFSIKDTSKAGNYEGEFKVDFLGDHCGKITFPVSEKIKVTIQDSITKTTVI
jgi:hypothetical protein